MRLRFVDGFYLEDPGVVGVEGRVKHRVFKDGGIVSGRWGIIHEVLVSSKGHFLDIVEFIKEGVAGAEFAVVLPNAIEF